MMIVLFLLIIVFEKLTWVRDIFSQLKDQRQDIMT